MEIKGTIAQILTEQTGMGKKGQWTKQEYILTTSGQYPKKICFSLWNKAIFEAGIVVGESVTVHVDLESREYNGRWYTEVKGWKVEHTVKQQEAQMADNSNDEDTLPF